MIRVYSLPDCIQCDLTKRAFDRRGIDYTEIPMTPEMVEEYRLQGVRTAPVVTTATMFWFGLRPDLIQEAANEALGRTRRHDGT